MNKLNLAEIVVRGCFEYDRDDSECAWAAALLMSHGWIVVDGEIDGMYFVRCDFKEHTRVDGSHYAHPCFAYDPLRWIRSTDGDEPTV